MPHMTKKDREGLTWQEIGSIIGVLMILYSIWHYILADGQVF